MAIQIFAHGVLEQRDVDDVFLLRNTDTGAEVADSLGRIPPPAQTSERRQARVVPSGHELLSYKRQQLALAHHRVVQIEACELDLLRTRLELARRFDERVDTPVIERPMILELQRTQ